MKKRTKYTILLAAVLCVLPVFYAEAAVPVGKIALIEGHVDILREGRLPAIAAKSGYTIFVKDIIRTKSDSKAEVTFNDGNILKIAQRSRIDISEYSADGENRASINMPRGKVEANVDKKVTRRISESPTANKFEIRTPSAIAGVRGTQYFTFHERGVTGVLVKEGKVETFNPKFPDIKVLVTAGQITTISENRPPAPPRAATDAEKKGHEKDVTPSDKPKDADKLKPEDKPADKPKETAKAEGQPAPAIQNGPAPVAPPPPPMIDPALIVAPPPPPATTYFLPPPPPLPPITETTTTTTSMFKVPITIKLTWGQLPDDLDSHLWVPPEGSGSHYHVYYGQMGLSGSYPYAVLDTDAMSGYGPETITIHKLITGSDKKYYYSVHCYGECGQAELSSSSAQVQWKDNSGTTYNYSVPTSGSGLWWNVLKFTSDAMTTVNTLDNDSQPLNFTKTLSGTTYLVANGFNSIYQNGSTNIWSETPAYVNMLGSYYASQAKTYDIWYGNVHSYNYKNYTATTYNGGAYYGFLGGIKSPVSGTTYDKVEGGFTSLYIDPADSNGVSRAGILKGTLTGIAYPYMGLMDIDAAIYRTEMNNNIGITPENLIANISKYSLSSNSSTSFMFNGSAMGDAHSRPYSYSAEFSGINGLGWGVYNADTTGSYTGITMSDNWNWSMTHNDGTRITGMEANGAQWSEDIIKAEQKGYYADITSVPQTGIYVGELKGTFNPIETGGTWMAVSMGAYVETNQLLTMLATESGKTKLQQLNIPVVEVGRANLSGSGNNLTVNMNNVIFLANQSGQKATMWATGNVNGTYSAAPVVNTAVAISGNGINANFTPTQWTGGKWMATVDGSGTYSGSGTLNNTAIQMKGAGAGTYSGGNLSGTAAGTVK